MSEIQRKQFPTVIRAMGDRMVSAIVSMESPDRDADTIAVDGWQLANFEKNPVVMWQHIYSEPPVGRAKDIAVVGTGLRATIEFPPPGLSARADEICGLVKAGFINATSVGFRPTPGCAKPNKAGGVDYSSQELLEFSFVGIPAHPAALVTQRSAMTQWLARSDPYSDGRPTSQRPIGARPSECPAGGDCANPNQDEACPAQRLCPLRGHALAGYNPLALTIADRRQLDHALGRLAAQVDDDINPSGWSDADVLAYAMPFVVDTVKDLRDDALRVSMNRRTGRVDYD